MTAIGLAMFCICLFLAQLAGIDRAPDAFQIVVGVGLITGFLLMLTGVFTWLWRVMP